MIEKSCIASRASHDGSPGEIMDIHEYQAKELLSGFGVAVPPGGVAYSPEQAVYVATELGGWHWAIKAQIHAGRARQGGRRQAVPHLSGSRGRRQGACSASSARHCTRPGPRARPFTVCTSRKPSPSCVRLYLGFVLDRKIERIRVIASAEGGVEIEEIAAQPTRNHSAAASGSGRRACRASRRASSRSAWASTSSR